AEERHVREHAQRVDRRRLCFGCQDLPVADTNPWLMRERRSQKRVDSIENSTRSSSQSWISFIARLRQRRGSRFTKNGAPAMRQLGRVPTLSAELEQERRVVILGEETEEHAPCSHERRGVLVPPVLEEPPE